MKIKFNCFSGEEIFKAYLNFIKKRNSQEVFIKYKSDKYGFREIMEGKLNINDIRLTELSKNIQNINTRHDLELYQKNWKITFRLDLHWEMDNDNGIATLTFDNSLKKEVYNHFKLFEPKEINK